MLIRILVLTLLFFSQLSFSAEPIKWSDLQKNIDSWLQGPPSLILTPDEKDVYKKLKTPEEKMQFIKIFWARRDPLLRTRENEFKQEFYNRVDYANQNFAEGSTPGWKSAMGQTYVIFGKPSRIDKQAVPGSSRPAQLWVYDKMLTSKIPPNEALMFVYRDFKYVLAPPNPHEGDRVGAQQRALDANFTYQSIPSVVQAAFSDVADKSVIDENKDYRELLTSVESTEKFGLQNIQFDVRPLQAQPQQYEVVMKPDTAPLYDSGDSIFAEFFFKQELKKGDTVVAANQHTASFNWDPQSFGNLKEIAVKLPPLEAPAGEYELYITVGDQISNVSETRKVQ
jgi:GWxTD domain-containing protein